MYRHVLPLSFVVVKYEDFTEELKEVEMNRRWKVGHDIKRDRLVQQVIQFTRRVKASLNSWKCIQSIQRRAAKFSSTNGTEAEVSSANGTESEVSAVAAALLRA